MFQNYRWFYTSSGKLVVGGKNAEQNEQLVKKVKPDDVIVHTAAPGSPFCVIERPTAEELKEVAQFCACFSQGWKKKKRKMEVHIFKGEQVVKEKGQAVGSFSVLGKVQKTKVKLELWLGFQKDKLRAAPKSCFEKPLMKLLPGKLSKEKAIKKIKKYLEKFRSKINEQEIASAIPAGGFKF